MSIDLWRKRDTFKLSEAALLLAGHDPDEFSDEQLLTKPPKRFRAIYGKLLFDATAVIDEAVQSPEDPNVYYTEYELMTDKAANAKKLSDQDGFSVHVYLCELLAWAKRKDFDLGLLDTEVKNSPEETELHPTTLKSLHLLIGALKHTLLEVKDEQFKDQSELITYLATQYKGYHGLGETTIGKAFTKANRALKEL